MARDRDVFPLEEAAPRLRCVSGSGDAPRLGTLIRWVRRGKRGARLEVRRVRGRLWTTEEAVARFLAAVAARGG